MTSRKRVLFLVGHSKTAQGMRIYNNESEYNFNCMIAQTIMVLYFGDDEKPVEISTKTKSSWFTLEREMSAEKIYYDAIIELHLNAAEGDARGCEVLAKEKDEQSIHLAESLAATISKNFNIPLRHETGCKVLTPGDRGYTNTTILSEFSRRVVLVEPCFAHRKTVEAQKIIESPMTYANTLQEWVKHYDF